MKIREVIAAPFCIVGLVFYIVGGGVGATIYSFGEWLAKSKKEKKRERTTPQEDNPYSGQPWPEEE